MKIIDSKGRLFGKINLIDFLIIFSLLLLIPFIYLGSRVVVKKPELHALDRRTFTDVEIYCYFKDMWPQTAKLVTVGDKEIDDTGVVIGEVTWVGKAIPHQYKLDVGAGEVIVHDDLRLKDMLVRLKVKAEIKSDLLYYKNDKIALAPDSKIFFECKGRYGADAYPISISLPMKTGLREPKETRKVVLPIIFRNLNQESANLISPGDREVDGKGKVVAEILSIGELQDNIYRIDLGDGKFADAVDFDTKQLPAKMILECEVKQDRELYFKGQKLTKKILFEFKTDRYTAYAQVATEELLPPQK